MSRISKDTATHTDHGPVEEWSQEVDGYSVNFVCLRGDLDQSPMLKGLPNDECQCPHWGYVLRGSLRFRVGGREEVYEAGDAFYLPPGHVGVGNAPGSEYVQFSPSDELRPVMETIMRNMEAMQGQPG
jgi:hypothetical protein